MNSANYTDQSAPLAADGLEVVDNSYPEAVDGYRKHADPGHGGYAGYEGYVATPAPSPPAVAAAAAEKQVAVVAPGEKRICGLRRSTLILLVVLAVVIVGAAVGGGVGGSMAVTHAYDRGYADAEAEALLSSPSNPDSNSNSGTDSSTDSDTDSGTNSTDSTDDTSVQNGRISSPPTTGKLLLDCPGLDGTIQTVTPQSKTYKFQAICGADSAPGERSKNIAAIVAYRLSDCLRACASMNERDNVGKDNRCGAVHWHVDLAFVRSHGGNCWLKKGYDKLIGGVDEDNADLHVFATLEGEN